MLHQVKNKFLSDVFVNESQCFMAAFSPVVRYIFFIVLRQAQDDIKKYAAATGFKMKVGSPIATCQKRA